MANNITLSSLIWASISGIVPALFWLWFWLKEDENPEPHKLIAFAFIGGMIMVPVAGFLQVFVREHFISGGAAMFLVWAAIEEILKLLSAMATTLFRNADDEPLDPVIYLIVTALGFAALENVLFVIDPIHVGSFTLSILTGNIRFIGASLLHVICSSIIGVMVGLAFYRPMWIKGVRTVIGLVFAVGLHLAFNLSIMSGNPSTTFGAFFAVWIAVIVLAVFFEKLKAIKLT